MTESLAAALVPYAALTRLIAVLAWPVAALNIVHLLGRRWICSIASRLLWGLGFGQLNGKIINNAANSGALGVVGVPAPVIGRGLPVLAVDGLFFGAKLLQRSKKHGPLGTVVAQAATPIPS